MDRGSFNGPFGPHHRFALPPNEGGSMSSGLMLRQRLQFGFVDSSRVLFLNRDGLAKSGVAVADVTARAVDPIPGTVSGVVVRLDGLAPQDKTPVDDPATNPLSSGVPNFNFYTMEVVQRLGYDSFTPDNGVLLAKNKDRASNTGGPNGPTVFAWTIDAHPEDIKKLDFKRPNGEPVMRSVADYRQLNDALFHVGTNSGSAFEWEDTANRLHFYVVDRRRDERGILVYTLAVRSLDGDGPHHRGVELSPRDTGESTRRIVVVGVTNTGRAAPIAANVHPRDASQALGFDVFRLSASNEGQGWRASLPNDLVAVRNGETRPIEAYGSPVNGASASATLIIMAKSESDPAAVRTVRIPIHR
jgi:hypothetical protein